MEAFATDPEDHNESRHDKTELSEQSEAEPGDDFLTLNAPNTPDIPSEGGQNSQKGHSGGKNLARRPSGSRKAKPKVPRDTPAQVEETITAIEVYSRMLKKDLKHREGLKLYWVDYRCDKAYYKSWNEMLPRPSAKSFCWTGG